MVENRQNTPPGPGVDASGQAVIDPTKNVLGLVAAETRRQDDLRRTSEQSMRREAKLREAHAHELRAAESARIDAIRAVDAQTSLNQAKVTVDTAEALRSRVDAAATATAGALVIALDPIRKDIADLRQSQYEGVGAKTQSTETGITARVWVGIVIAIGSVLSTAILGAAAILVTVLLH